MTLPVLLAGFMLIAIATVEGQSCAQPDADVLILGAGMAGINAAKTLHEAGRTNFVILEALDRIGGRVNSVQFAGAKVELGANWIQGVDPQQPDLHPLWAIAQKCGLQGDYSNYDSYVAYNRTGEDITNSDLLRFDDWNAAYERAENIGERRQEDGQQDISARSGLTMAGWEPLTPVDDYVEWYSFDLCVSEPPEVSSLFGAIADTGFGDPERTTDWFVTDARGFVYLVDCLADEFLDEGDERLHLNANVSMIEWSEDCVCVTATENGTQKQYCAPYAITTFSLGVLQSEELNMRFEPSLPQWKLDAINDLSMAHLLKIFIEFNETFWDENVEFIGYVANEKGYYPSFQPLGLLPGSPTALLAVLTHDIADRVARQPIEDTTAELLQVLRNIYGDNVSELVDIIVPQWDLDPLFFGTYSNRPVGATDETHEMIAAPVGRLYFSGEAACPKYSSFVHGAYIAGERSANAIIGEDGGGALMPVSITVLFTLSLVSFFSY